MAERDEPIEWGVNVIPECPIDEVVAIAVQAETQGFSRCLVYDEGLVTRDVYITLAAIAAATSSLKLGPGITNPYTRHPAQTAAAIASLDEYSGGRAFLGIGAGGSLTLDPIGLARTKPLTAVRETIAVARKLFSGEPVDFAGTSVTLTSAHMSYGRPGTEIWLAGRGPKMLALGGEMADGVMLDFIHKPSLGESVARVRAENPNVRLSYSTSIVTNDAELEVVRPHMTYRLVDAPPDIKTAIGLSDADADRIRSAMASGLHAAAEHVRDEWIDPFIVRGDAASCRAEIEEICGEHNMEAFIVPMFEMADPVGYLEALAVPG